MALVVEDGSIVTGANTYASLATIRNYATLRGKTVPTDDMALEALNHLSMDWLESKRTLFKGRKTAFGQPLQWPRAYVSIDSYYSLPPEGYIAGGYGDLNAGNLYYAYDFQYNFFPVNQIPQELIDVLCELCIAGAAGIDFMPNAYTQAIKSEKIAATGIETEYDLGIAVITPYLAAAEAKLRILLKNNGAGGLTVGRG